MMKRIYTLIQYQFIGRLIRKFFSRASILPFSKNKKLARDLNFSLFADVDSIPQQDLQRFRERMLYYCRKLCYTPEYTKSWMEHVPRLYLTLQWLKVIVNNQDQGCIVVEAGGETVVTHLFKEYFPQVKWLLTQGDLRYDWGLVEHTADIILATEVIEHLADPPQGFQESFEMLGLKNFLKLSHQILKPNGMLFMTTPNSSSIVILKSILNGFAPRFFVRHVYEYCLPELIPLLQNHGFSIVKAKTIHCLTAHYREDYTPVYNMLLQHQYETRDRGDDIFIVAQKNR